MIHVQVIQLQLIPQESTNSSKALHELIALLGLISDEFKAHTVLLVVVADPLC